MSKGRHTRKARPAAQLINADQVLEGLFEWLRDNPWFLDDKFEEPDPAYEAAAQAALLDLARGDVDGYRSVSDPVRRLANYLITDYLAKLMGPFAKSTWPVSPGDGSRLVLQRAAWSVVALELERTTGRRSVRH